MVIADAVLVGMSATLGCLAFVGIRMLAKRKWIAPTGVILVLSRALPDHLFARWRFDNWAVNASFALIMGGMIAQLVVMFCEQASRLRAESRLRNVP